MAITVTVASNDITAYVPMVGYGGLPGLSIREEASAHTSVAKFAVADSSGSVSISVGDAVTIADGATTLFSGRVCYVDREPRGANARQIVVTCHDNNILLEETVIEAESFAIGVADSFIIGDATDGLFPNYLSSIDSSTYVSTLDSSTEAMDFIGLTLRQCMDEICRRTSGRYYVDYDDNLHYFSSESNAAAWNLSDAPDFSATYPYKRLREREDGTVLIDKVLIIGDNVSGWMGSGDHEYIVFDENVKTAQGVTDRGNALIGRYASALKQYTLVLMKDGLRAGMDIDLTNSILGLSAETLTVRSIEMRCVSDDGTKREYSAVLGATVPDGVSVPRAVNDSVRRHEGAIKSINDEVFDDDAPAAPTFVDGNLSTGVSTDADGHQYAWIKATWGSVGDSDLDHYEIQCADNTSFNYPQIFHVQAGDTQEVVFSGLLGNTAYYLRVRAVDWTGNYSAWSPASPGYLTKTTSKDTTAPAQVAGLSAGASRTLIGLSWTANTESDLAHYEIERAPDVSGSPGTYAQIAVARLNYYIDEDFSDAQIAAEDTFWYRVRAVDTSGNQGTYATQTSAALSRIKDDHITANTITAASIAGNTITASEIAAGTITATEIATGTITGTQITGSTLSAIYADLGTVTAGEMRIGSGDVGVDFTGFRIMSSYLAGYSSDTLQAGIRVSDGKFICCAGNITMDASGITLPCFNGTAYDADSSIKLNVGATTYSIVGAHYQSNNYHVIQMRAKAITSHDSTCYLAAEVATGQTATSYISVPNQMVRVRETDGSAAFTQIYANAPKLYLSSAASPSNSDMTRGITVDQDGSDDEILAGKSSDVAHGITSIAETDTYFDVLKVGADTGGVNLRGFTESEVGLRCSGFGVTDDTNKDTSGNAYIEICAYKKDGVGVTDVGADGNLVVIRNNTTTRFIFDAEGSFHADVECTTFDQYDDVALLDKLEEAMSADRAVLGDFGGWLDANKGELERLNIAHFDEAPGHAMVNWTRLSMLQTGAIRQLAQRCERYERALLALGANPALLEGA